MPVEKTGAESPLARKQREDDEDESVAEEEDTPAADEPSSRPARQRLSDKFKEPESEPRISRDAFNTIEPESSAVDALEVSVQEELNEKLYTLSFDDPKLDHNVLKMSRSRGIDPLEFNQDQVEKLFFATDETFRSLMTDFIANVFIQSKSIMAQSSKEREAMNKRAKDRSYKREALQHKVSLLDEAVRAMNKRDEDMFAALIKAIIERWFRDKLRQLDPIKLRKDKPAYDRLLAAEEKLHDDIWNVINSAKVDVAEPVVESEAPLPGTGDQVALGRKGTQ
jgi:hypothetical protein